MNNEQAIRLARIRNRYEAWLDVDPAAQNGIRPIWPDIASLLTFLDEALAESRQWQEYGMARNKQLVECRARLESKCLGIKLRNRGINSFTERIVKLEALIETLKAECGTNLARAQRLDADNDRLTADIAKEAYAVELLHAQLVEANAENARLQSLLARHKQMLASYGVEIIDDAPTGAQEGGE